jgi:hypothetical protein
LATNHVTEASDKAIHSTLAQAGWKARTKKPYEKEIRHQNTTHQPLHFARWTLCHLPDQFGRLI